MAPPFTNTGCVRLAVNRSPFFVVLVSRLSLILTVSRVPRVRTTLLGWAVAGTFGGGAAASTTLSAPVLAVGAALTAGVAREQPFANSAMGAIHNSLIIS